MASTISESNFPELTQQTDSTITLWITQPFGPQLTESAPRAMVSLFSLNIWNVQLLGSFAVDTTEEVVGVAKI